MIDGKTRKKPGGGVAFCGSAGASVTRNTMALMELAGIDSLCSDLAKNRINSKVDSYVNNIPRLDDWPPVVKAKLVVSCFSCA
jgi:hypothetical protein